MSGVYIMRVLRSTNRVVLLAAFLVCIGAGFTLAVVLRERLGGTAEADPCFGQGELVASWKHEITQADIDSLKASRPELADMKPGMVEYRRCRWGPGYEVIIDEKGHVFSFSQPTLAELEAYYKEHPEENPQNQIATAEAESRAKEFVTPALPAEKVLTDTILAGCDPTWQKRDFSETGLRVCFPSGWTAQETPPEANIQSSVISVTFEPKPSREVLLDCAEPALIKTPTGDARLCSYQPNIGELGQGHEIALPNGHRARFFIADPTEENTMLALRIALAAEELP